MKDIYTIMNRQNILNFYGSKLDLKLDSSELYDYQLAKNEVDYDTEVLDVLTPIVYPTLVIDTNLTDFDCDRTTITLTEYDNRVNDTNYPYSGLTTTLSYSGFTNHISHYHKKIILNNDVYIFEGITDEVHFMKITGYNNPLSFDPNMGNSSDEIVNKFNNEYFKCTSKLTTTGSRACCPITPKLSSKPWAYQFYQIGTNCTTPIIKQRTENGWTLDFIFNRENLPWTEGNIFYYYGVRGSTSITETADNSLLFKFTNDGEIEYNVVRYSGDCDPSIGYSENYYTEVGVTSALCTTDLNKDFNITIVFDRYKELKDCELENEGGLNDQIPEFRIYEYVDLDSESTSTQIAVHNDDSILNKKWWGERNKRLGVLKIFLNGNLIHEKENFEEVIASNRGIQPFIQSWGGVNNDEGGVCCFNIKSIKYYEEPLNFLQIRHNFNIIKSDYDFEICGPVCVDTVIVPTPTPTPTPTPVPTNTPSPTPTNAPTFTPTPTITPTPGPTDTPTPTPTPFITPTPYPFTTQLPGGFTFDADYIIVSYAFTDGNDLDTRTRISSPNIGQNSAQSYLGWCRSELFPDNGGTPILTWSGDNTGLGFESVFVNLIEFKNQYPSENSLTIEMSAMWYSDPLDPESGPLVGVNPVIMDVMLYKGGNVSLVQSDFLFINEGYSGIYGVASEGKVVTTQSQECFSQELVAKLQYNLTTYNGQFI